MTKKDYQAIARAIFETRRISAEQPWDGERIIKAIADVLAADNPRFNHALFIEACETGRCKGMRG